MREVGLASLDILTYEGRTDKAEKTVKYELALKKLASEARNEAIYGKNGKIVEMWKDAEESLFNLSRVDGKLTMDDFWKMNVYDFLRYKKMLIKHLKRNKK